MVIVISSILNFLVVVTLVWYFARKPAAQFLVDRTRNISQQLNEAKRMSEEAQAMLGEWESKSKAMEAHSKQLTDEAMVAATRTREKVIAQAKHEAKRILQDTKQIGESEIIRSRESLKKEVIQKSVEMARAYLTNHLSEKDRHKLVSTYMEIVGNGSAG